MLTTFVKLLVAAVLFGAWMYFTIYPLPNSGAIVSFIQTTLVGLAAHTVLAPTPQAVPVTQPPAIVQPEDLIVVTHPVSVPKNATALTSSGVGNVISIAEAQ